VAYQATSLGISRCDGRDMPTVAQLLRELSGQRKMGHTLLAVRAKNKMASVRAIVERPLAYRGRHSAICQWIRSRVVAKFAGSGQPVCTSMGCATVRTVALRREISKRKTGLRPLV
jgi:hypothetical protein